LFGLQRRGRCRPRTRGRVSSSGTWTP
jgi:hypothetical protein